VKEAISKLEDAEEGKVSCAPEDLEFGDLIIKLLAIRRRKWKKKY
jgi:hypothetical protein